MTRDEMISALEMENWYRVAVRAHCVEWRKNVPNDFRWIELWDNGDCAFGVHDQRITVGTYERICGTYLGDKYVHAALIREIDDAVRDDDHLALKALLIRLRKTIPDPRKE